MKYPKFLENSDTISLSAPSLAMCGKWYGKRGKIAIKTLKKEGYSFKLTKSTTKRFTSPIKNTSFADKANELLEAYKDKDTKILWSVAGGEVMEKTIENLDTNSFKHLPPKWFIGMSDNTWLGFLLPTICDVASIYSYNFPTMGALPYNESQENLLKVLRGELLIQHSYDHYSTKKPLKATDNNEMDKKTCWKSLDKKDVHIEGRFIGGCLDVLLCILGTKYDHIEKFCKKYQDEGIILFVEACDLNVLDQLRAYDQIKNTNWFKYLKGIVIGRPLRSDKFFNVKYTEMLHTEFDNLDIPVIYDFDTGHTSPMITLINGGYAIIDLHKKKGTIEFKLI